MEIYEIFLWDSETVEKHDHLPVKVALAKSARSDHIESQVRSFEFDLGGAKRHFDGSLHFRVNHHYPFCTRQSDLESTGLSVTHFTRNSGCELLVDVAHPVAEAKSISLDVWNHTKLHLRGVECGDVGCGAETLALPRELLKDISFLIEISHVLRDLKLAQVLVGIVLTEEPASMCFQLTIGVAQKFELQGSQREASAYDLVDVAQQEIDFRIPTEVEIFV